jgi:hypothetical protein
VVCAQAFERVGPGIGHFWCLRFGAADRVERSVGFVHRPIGGSHARRTLKKFTPRDALFFGQLATHQFYAGFELSLPWRLGGWENSLIKDAMFYGFYITEFFDVQ